MQKFQHHEPNNETTGAITRKKGGVRQAHATKQGIKTNKWDTYSKLHKNTWMMY